MELLQSVGQTYLEKKAYGAPQQIEDLVKKQFARPHESSTRKSTHGHTDKRSSKSHYDADLESVTLHPPKASSSVSRNKSDEMAGVRQQLSSFDFEHGSGDVHKRSASTHSRRGGHSERDSVVSRHSVRSDLAPSQTGMHRSRSERRSSHAVIAAPYLHSHATAPTIVVSEAGRSHKGSHAPSEAPSYRTSHSKSRASEARFKAASEAPSHGTVRSKSQVSEARTVRGRSHQRNESPETFSVAHSHKATSDAGRSHRSSRSHSRHSSHSFSSPSETGSRLTQENLEALSITQPIKSEHAHAPSHSPSHHTSPSKKSVSTVKVSKAGHEEHELVAGDAASFALSRAQSHLSRHSKAPTVQVIKTSHENDVDEDAVSHAPSHARSQHTIRAASHAGTSRASASDWHDHQVASVVHSHAPSKAASHHSTRHSHVNAAKSSRARSESPGAESVADSIYPESSISQRSERSHLSHTPSHYSHHSSHSHNAPSHAPSHHSSHSHHSKASQASTLKGSRHADQSPDRHSHASSHTLKSHHSHHSKAVDSDSSNDEASEHGGSAALLHQRQKYRRSISRGRAPKLTPVEEREECFGKGFRPHRSRSNVENGIIEVRENKMIMAPKVREIKREKEFQMEKGWWHHGTEVVEVKREANGHKVYRIR